MLENMFATILYMKRGWRHFNQKQYIKILFKADKLETAIRNK